jgi:hypothetical protein
MKSLHIFSIFSASLIVITGCKKNNADILTLNTSAQNSTGTTLVAIAGPDRTVYTPKSSGNEIYLIGAATDKENKIQSYHWGKISGPGSSLIEASDNQITKVSSLNTGLYQFELTVTDSKGLVDKRKVNITIEQTNDPLLQHQNGAIVFKNLKWIFPWYNSVEVKDFVYMLPSGVSFSSYIQRSNSQDWVSVPLTNNISINSKYEYFIERRPDGGGIYSYGSMYIFNYGDDVTDNPTVKIIY